MRTRVTMIERIVEVLIRPRNSQTTANIGTERNSAEVTEGKIKSEQLACAKACKTLKSLGEHVHK